ncbi:MAG: Ig-like domain-containing protein [Bacteroidetes bacterium]|nr:Ig-like domain-containing protein [Bacteroidota bacterium]MBI3482986.1 Ig-like domain-containing protein [Bacteroidota bacterium]
MKKLIFIFIVIFLWQCARQSMPAGGPQDKTPPELLSSIPSNSEKNFKGKTIELTFDELVKLKDPQEEIIITPSVGSKTKFNAKKNKIVILPERNWKDSTTYSIAFRSGIQDVNESNAVEDLHLAFSTGPSIDSLQILGSVYELFRDKIPEKITVAVYQSDTFDIFKHKPTYFSKTNKSGAFSLQNLKAGKYFIYAFDDKNKNFKVDSKSERFGFLNQEINLPEKKDSLHIAIFHVDARPIKITSVRNTNSISMIRFNKQLDAVRLKSETSPLIYTYGDLHSEIVLYKEFDKRDSLLINVHAFDSVQQELDTAVYIKYTDSKKLDEKFKLSDWQTTFDTETKKFEAQTTLSKLLLSINFDSTYIQIDTTNFQLIKPSEIKFDTLNKLLKINTTLKIADKENIPKPVLLLGKGAIVSIDNDSTKAQEIKINIPKPKDTGILSLEINTKESHFEVQLLSSNGTLIKSFRDLKKYTFKYLAPGEYKISVIVDTNNNGKWDAGTIYKKAEPEKVILYKNSENKFTFPIRANWEVGPLVITF